MSLDVQKVCLSSQSGLNLYAKMFCLLCPDIWHPNLLSLLLLFFGVKLTFCEPFLLHLNNLIASADEVRSGERERERESKFKLAPCPSPFYIIILLQFSIQFNSLCVRSLPLPLSLSLSLSSAISFHSARVWASEILFYLIFPSHSCPSSRCSSCTQFYFLQHKNLLS